MATRGTPSIMRVQQRDIARAASYPAAPVTLFELLTGGLWILFFIVASYGATPLKDFGVERLAWLAADLVALVIVLLRSDEMLAQMRRNLVIMSWPALACVSALWSLDPAFSLYQGLQLLLTMLVGLCLIVTADLRRILILLFLALVTAGVLSTLYELGGAGGRRTVGIFSRSSGGTGTPQARSRPAQRHRTRCLLPARSPERCRDVIGAACAVASPVRCAGAMGDDYNLPSAVLRYLARALSLGSAQGACAPSRHDSGAGAPILQRQRHVSLLHPCGHGSLWVGTTSNRGHWRHTLADC